MGTKGDKLSNDSIISAELLVEKLNSIGGVTTKKMFGGHGIFHNSKMFGLIDSKGISFLKVNESNKADFEKKGSIQHSRMPYFSIPKDVQDNQDELVKWVQKSIEINM